MANKEQFVVSGIAYWACVHTVNRESDKYQIDVCQLSDEMVELCSSHGLKIRNENDERENFITAKTKFAPRVVNLKKADLPESVLVGNGSKVNVVVHPYSYVYKGKPGIGTGFDAVQVVELVEYGKSPLDLLDGDGDDLLPGESDGLPDGPVKFGD